MTLIDAMPTDAGAGVFNKLAEDIEEFYWDAYVEGCDLTLRLSASSAGAWEILDAVMRTVDEKDRVVAARAWRKANPDWKPSRSHQRDQITAWGIGDSLQFSDRSTTASR